MINQGQSLLFWLCTLVEDNSHYGLLVGNEFIPFLKFQLQLLTVIKSGLFLEIQVKMGGFSNFSVSIELAPDGTSSPMIRSIDPGFI